jgi:polysaccharide export outer membrane protein
MGKFIGRHFVRTTALLFLVGCSQIVEPVVLPELQNEATDQEAFEINLQALSFDAAKSLNAARYDRLVSKPGAAFSADAVSEASLSKPFLPSQSANTPYFLGIGDEVALVQYIDGLPTIGSMSNLSEGQNRDISATSNIISTKGRVGTDGSLLLIGVGRLDANGRQISELRDEIRTILIRNGKAPNFQLEIVGFNSKQAFITTDSSSGANAVIPITDGGVTLREVIATAGIGFDERVLTIVRVKRNETTYTIGLSDLLVKNSKELYLKNQDHVFVQSFSYQPGKVFLLGGVKPQIIPILPESRQTLAEALFAKDGPLAIASAQRSAVYLLRGRNPVQAYHLDAQNPLRVLVANEVELRPNDIVFVSEQPISTFNRALGSILPLRILLRDIENGDIP